MNLPTVHLKSIFLSPEIKKLVYSLNCTQRPLKDFEGKRYTAPAADEKLPDWELRSKGYLKHAKAVFCLGVRHLEIAIITDHPPVLR